MDSNFYIFSDIGNICAGMYVRLRGENDDGRGGVRLRGNLVWFRFTSLSLHQVALSRTRRMSGWLFCFRCLKKFIYIEFAIPAEAGSW